MSLQQVAATRLGSATARRIMAAAAIGICAAALVACGSSPTPSSDAVGTSGGDVPAAESSAEDATSGDSGTGASANAAVTDAQAIAEKYLKPVTDFTGPTDGPPAQANKTVWFMACGLAGEGCATAAQGAETAGKALGWNVRIVDGKFDPQVFARTMREAVDQHIDGIIIDAIDANSIKEPIAQARAAGIVVGSYDSNNDPSDTGVSYDVRVSFEEQGKAMAAYMIWKSNGDAQPYILNSPEFKGTAVWTAAATKLFEDCSSCKIVDSHDFTAATAATTLPPLVVSAKKQNPGMNVLLVPYDAAALPIVPEMQHAGILGDVMVGVFNATTPTVAMIRKGDETVAMAEPQSWGAWASMDNMNRVFAGQEAIEQNIPIRLITQENVSSIAEGDAWEGDDVDYQAAYKAIWNK
jgi:ribose transport system substrate-binding protein